MRFPVIVLLMFTAFQAFAADIPARINDTVTLSQAVTPDIMKSELNITYLAAGFREASAGIEKMASVIRANPDTCSFDSYMISPKYSYENNKRMLEGYQASLSSPCSFDDIIEFDAVLNAVSSVISKNKAYQISVSPVMWTVSEKLSSQVTDRLKTELLGAVDAKSKLYAETMSRRCSTSVVTYAGASVPPEMPLARFAAAENFKSTPPDRNSKDISVSADFTLVCK